MADEVTTSAASERDCPCCTGLTESAWEDLCDACLAAWLANDWDHDCDRPGAA